MNRPKGHHVYIKLRFPTQRYKRLGCHTKKNFAKEDKTPLTFCPMSNNTHSHIKQ